MKNYETPMDTFEYVKFTHPTVVEGHEMVKRVAEEMEDVLRNSISSPRHLALAITRLEEVMFWAGKGFANDQKQINLIREGGEENLDTTTNL
jgi:hypothetical protein